MVISSLWQRYQCFVGTTELASKTNAARQNGSGLHSTEEVQEVERKRLNNLCIATGGQLDRRWVGNRRVVGPAGVGNRVRRQACSQAGSQAGDRRVVRQAGVVNRVRQQAGGQAGGVGNRVREQAGFSNRQVTRSQDRVSITKSTSWHRLAGDPRLK